MCLLFCLLSSPDSNMLPSSLSILGWIFKWEVLAHLGRNLLNASCIKLLVSELLWEDYIYLHRLTLFPKGLEFIKYHQFFFQQA